MQEVTGEPATGPSPDQRRYRVLLELTALVARTRTLNGALQQIAPSLLSLTGGTFLNISLHDPRHDRMDAHYWKANLEDGDLGSFPVDDSAAGWAWKHQETLAIPDIQNESRFPGCLPALRDHGIRSYTVLPVSTATQHFGALGLGRSVSDRLAGEDIELLSHIASVGALALDNQQSGHSLTEQRSLVAISRELTATLELDRLLPVILSSVRSIVDVDRTVLSLLDESGENVYLYGEAPSTPPSLPLSQTVPLEKALSGPAIRTRCPVFFSADDLRARNSPLARAMLEIGVLSVCAVPLIARDRVWGALHAASLTENAFGPSEVEYLQQVATQIAVALQNAHTYREIRVLKDRALQEKRYLESEVLAANRADDIVGSSSGLKRVLDYAAIVADTDSTVLITGETGTGKERIARMIHERSRRRDRSFIKLNCAAIPTGLLESELFGHEKGAFTGAVSQKIGRLELADQGTLFLDEIGEIALELQPKLLRVLQDHEFERLGGTKTLKVDVRVIAATNRDLAKAVEEKEFRGDLFYRLHVFPLHIPPLRDRREDIPLLIHHFVEKSAARMRKRIDFVPDEAVQAMMHWPWPGNIRELENFIERSVILTEGNRLNAPLSELRERSTQSSPQVEGTLRDKERDHIIQVLRETGGTLSGPHGAAARLGLKRTTLQYKMQRLGISRSDYLK